MFNFAWWQWEVRVRLLAGELRALAKAKRRLCA